MYIFELITKKFIRNKKKEKGENYNPEGKENIIEDPQDCEHLFLPIDSTNEYFACKYCGIVVHKDKLKNNHNK